MNYITAAHTIDGYKVSHKDQYPVGTTQVYSNFTARNSKYFKQDTFDGNVVNFGMQYLVTYLHQLWVDTFFSVPKSIAIKGIRDRLSAYSGHTDISHFEKLHDFGYLPITIKALPEGTLVPLQTPMLTITNTHPAYFWLPNYLETFISCELWHIIASATLSRQYLKVLTKWSDLTCDNAEHLPWQAHDFSMRGHTSIHSAAKSGAAHLLSFMGTDTIPSVDFLEYYYRDSTGHSIPASEHSTMTAQIQSRMPELDIRDAETATFKDLLTRVYPSGIVALVSDSYNFWDTLTITLPELQDTIMARDGKLVIRPDCYDDKTLLMTDKGWKLFKDLTKEDLVAQVLEDGSYAFVKPIKYVADAYVGPMVKFSDKKGKIDLLVTPNHRMIIQQNGKERVIEAINMKSKGNYEQKMTRTASAPSLPSRAKLSPIEQLMVAFQADGSYTTSGNKIRFSFAKQRKTDRLKSILIQAKIPFKIYNLSDSRVEFNIQVDSTAYSKNFDWVDSLELGLTKEWCQSFIEELSYWDSTRRSDSRFKFDTTNKAVSDVVEKIAIGAGYGVLQSIYPDDRNDKFNDIYTSHILKDNKIGGQSWTKSIEHYEGYVYCVQVPTGKLLVKRNRCTMVCGNSGNPIDVICGTYSQPSSRELSTPQEQGAIEVLWDIFGGTVNDKGYKVLDTNIGLIYGDSITIDRANEICKRLEAKGFASSNVVFGLGSYTYQGTTRDTFGMAIKATAITNSNKLVELYKDPVGDSSKKSAKGLMRVDLINNEYVTQDQVSWEVESGGCLAPIYSDGTILSRERFSTIKARLS